MPKIELPDFNDMIKIAEQIYNLSQKRAELDIKIKIGETLAVKNGMETIKIDGKKPSISYLETTVKVTGMGNELIEMRKEYADLTNKILYLKELLELYKLQIEVWRTLSANERVSLL